MLHLIRCVRVRACGEQRRCQFGRVAQVEGHVTVAAHRVRADAIVDDALELREVVLVNRGE